MDWFGYHLNGVAWIGPVLGTFIFAWGGQPFLAGAVHEIRGRQPGMMLLIAMAITVAWSASMSSSLGWFDLEFWWELAALVTIMLLGHWQEMKAIGQARGALAAVAALLPDEAERIGPNDVIEQIAIGELLPGDRVLVRSGARVPADGRIIEGEAELDESMITGESRPVAKGPGDRVVAGTVSTDSSIRVEVDAVGENTALAGIQRLVADAQASSSRAQVLADRFAALLFYVATGAAIITFISWALVGDMKQAIEATVTVLVVACPHALGLAIPLVIALSTALAARNGILVKDRLALERMRTVDAVLFDKTGTLTKGNHVVTGIATTDRDEASTIALAASVEAESEHPLARAIIARAQSFGDIPKATDIHSLTGRGVEAAIHGVVYRVGGPVLIRERKLDIPNQLTSAIDGWTDRGASVLYLVEGDRVIGAFGLEDEIKPNVPSAPKAPKSSGPKIGF